MDVFVEDCDFHNDMDGATNHTWYHSAQLSSCATDLFTDFLPFFVPNVVGRFLVQTLMPRLMGAKTTDEGSVSTLFLLFSPDVGTGRYYGSDAKRSPLDVYRSAGSPAYEGP